MTVQANTGGWHKLLNKRFHRKHLKHLKKIGFKNICVYTLSNFV